MPSCRTSFPSLGSTTSPPLYSFLLLGSRGKGSEQAWMSTVFLRWSPCTMLSWWSSSGLPGSWGVLSYLCPAHKTPAAPHLPLSAQQSGVAPATSNTKATTMIISRLIHTASVTAVYASRFGFPYTGKTRFRSGDSPYRMGFEPIRLLQQISSVALSPPIPTLQALPGATTIVF